MKSLLFLKSYILKYRKRFFTGIAFVLMTNAVSMAAPRLLGYIIDSLRSGITMNRLLILSGLFLAIALVQGIFRFFMRILMMGLSSLVEYNLRNDFFSHLHLYA